MARAPALLVETVLLLLLLRLSCSFPTHIPRPHRSPYPSIIVTASHPTPLHSTPLRPAPVRAVIPSRHHAIAPSPPDRPAPSPTGNRHRFTVSRPLLPLRAIFLTRTERDHLHLITQSFDYVALSLSPSCDDQPANPDMSDRNSPPPAASGRRRSSFAGLADLFSRPSANASGANHTTTSAYPGPITSAAAEAQRRRLSVSTVGLSGSPTQPTPFGSLRSRTESISSANSASVDESPFEEGDAPATSVPASPFARRLSFGARALRDVRTSNGNGNPNGRSSVDKVAFTSPTAKGRGLSSSACKRKPRCSVSLLC